MRKLAIVSFAFAAGIFAAHYAIPSGWMIYASAGAAALGFGAFFLSGDKRLRVQLACFAACVGMLWHWAYGGIFLRSVKLLEGKTAEISVTAEDYPQKTEYGRRVYVRAAAEGEKPVKAVLYVYDASADSAEPGDVICGNLRFYAESDVSDSYNSRGIFLRAVADGSVTVESKASNSPRYLPVKAAHAVREKIDELFAKDCAPFMRALLTGDRSVLDADNAVTSSLQTTGVSHIVAVSGMHMSFIVSIVMLLCGRRKSRAAVCIPFILAFMVFTGSSPSVVRAGVMQSLVILAPMVSREYDPWTNLGFSLMLLLAVNPYSAASVGLQLSFAAVAGITLITPKLSSALIKRALKLKISKPKPCRAVIVFVCAALASTAGAVVFTTPLTALHFSYVSIISPLTNLLVLWAVSIAFTLGVFACALGFVLAPVGLALARAVSWVVRYILLIVKLLARVPFAAVYTQNEYMLFWLIFVFAFAVVLLLRPAWKRRCLIFAASFALSLALAIGLTLYDVGDLEITAVNVGQGQCIALRSMGATAVIDCGGNIQGGAGNALADYLLSVGENKIDCMVLTHFHSDHTNGIEELLDRVEVKAVVAPKLITDDGKTITDTSRAAGIHTVVLSKEETMQLGKAEIRFLPPAENEGEEACMSVVVSCGDFELIATGDITAKMEEKLLDTYGLPDAEVLIAGHHGSKKSLSDKLLETIAPKAVIISVGRNSYGHPAEETIEKIKRAGCALYRTDISGNITIRMG